MNAFELKVAKYQRAFLFPSNLPNNSRIRQLFNLSKYSFRESRINVSVVINVPPGTLISLISVEVGINVEGVQKLPNH